MYVNLDNKIARFLTLNRRRKVPAVGCDTFGMIILLHDDGPAADVLTTKIGLLFGEEFMFFFSIIAHENIALDTNFVFYSRVGCVYTNAENSKYGKDEKKICAMKIFFHEKLFLKFTRFSC